MDEIKKLQEIAFKTLPIIYLVGFCVVNGYLSNFGFTEYNILNTTFLKAGLFLFCGILPFIILTYYSFTVETMTDNLEKAYPSMLHAFYQMNVLVFMVTFPYVKWDNTNSIIFCVFMLYCFVITAYPIKQKLLNKNKFLCYTLATFPFILLLIWRSIGNTIVMKIWGFAAIIGMLSFISLGEYGDKNYKVQIIRDFFFLIILSFNFGKYLYGDLPTTIGGGKSYKIASTKKLDIFNDSLINLDTFQVLYESDLRFLLKNSKGKVLAAKKDDLNTLMIIKE